MPYPGSAGPATPGAPARGRPRASVAVVPVPEAAGPAPVRLAPGDPAPPFTLPDADGQPVSLADLAGQAVVLYAYPAASTPGCTTEACDFRDQIGRLRGAGYAVLGLSPDPPEALRRFRDQHGLPFRLLSDPERGVLRAYGAYGTKKLYGREVVGVIRSTFVIGPDGLLREALYNVRATGHVAALARRLGLA